MRFHNQIFILFSAALLGLFAFRIGKKACLPPFENLLMAISCQVLYQTFPPNLFHFWEPWPSTVAIPFLLTFILLLENINNDEKPDKGIKFCAGLCAFFAFYLDPPPIGFFFAFLALCWLFFGNRQSFKNNYHKITLYPALAALCVIAAQFVLAKINYPDVEFIGSSFWTRTGLDGSIEHYKGHISLITRRKLDIFKWYFLFIGGMVGFFIYIFNHRHLKDNITMLAVSSLMCLYFPMAFLLSQGVSIHPKYFDAYLAIPMILLLFCITPLLFTVTNNRWNGFMLLFFIVAFCYTFVQLRTYMATFPFIQ